MSTKFFTNENENTLLNKFAGIFENNKDIYFFEALVGYFRASGYFAIRQYLKDVPRIRILVGIDVDKILARYHAEGLLFRGDATATVDAFVNSFRNDLQRCAYTKEVEDGIVQFINDIASKKIELKAHPHRKLHAKIYIFRPENWGEHKAGYVITGSSNLTDAGLGKGKVSNYEFNVLLNDYDDVKFSYDEFEKLWNESTDILPTKLEKIKEASHLNETITPFQLYIKTITEYFGRSIDFDPNSVLDLPKGFKKLSYQVDAVNQGYELLKKHNGFFLSDVVGLGKTIIAIMIAKKFFYSNNYPAHISKTLIVVPPAMKDSWEETAEQFGLQNYKIETNGSLHKVRNPKTYDLVIVDEAHKFRNDTADAYDQLQRFCKSPTTQTDASGISLPKKVILVSATPLNNCPEDIRNLVYLFQDGRDSTLDISNLASFFARITKEYKAATKNGVPLEGSREQVAKIYNEIRENIIVPLTIRRTRTDLMAHEQYKEDLKKQGISFPEVGVPHKLFYQLDVPLDNLYDKTLKCLTAELTYNRYQAIAFLKPDKKSKYKSADSISFQLKKIMKTLLVKRLDSSFHSFKTSLHRFKIATGAMITMFQNGKIYIAPNLNVTEYIVDEREDELISLLAVAKETDPSIEIFTPDDFQPHFLTDLQKDFDILKDLVNSWDSIHYDPKYDNFTKCLKEHLLNKPFNHSGKLVIFSEAMDTTEYLYTRLKEDGFTKILSVNSGNRNELKTVIRENFDANYPSLEQKNEYNIIISTDVLSEGVNLHRSNIIVNYDTPWNATRLMQRIGRVNRIGSKGDKVHVFNFFPTAQVNSSIELEKKAVLKLQAFHSALGEDSQIYSDVEEVGTFGLFDRKIEEEKDERLSVLMELREFKEKNPTEFRIINNLPLKARSGRFSSQEPLPPGNTVCYLKNSRRDVFYHIDSKGSIGELSFLKAVEILKCVPSTPRAPLIENHYEQVNGAIDDFNKKVQAEAISNKVVDMKPSPSELKALRFLEAVSKMEKVVSDKELYKIKAAKKAIHLAKYQHLQRDIARLQKTVNASKLSITATIEALMKILDRYIEDYNELLQEKRLDEPIIQVESVNPDIIISESFTQGNK